MSEPRGPVYLTLPREVLANAGRRTTRRDTVRPLGVAAPEPARAAIEEAAALIAKAEFPLIVTSTRRARRRQRSTSWRRWREEFAIPVVQAEARDINLPTDHPMHLGFETGALSRQGRRRSSCIDSVVPWMPRNDPAAQATPRSSTSRPTRWQTRYPFREIEADLLIAGDPLAALRDAARDARPTR